MEARLRERGRVRILLHSCCGPCSSHCLWVLTPVAQVDIFYYNPNIYPEEEYLLRKSEQMRLLKEAFPQVKAMDADYSHGEYLQSVRGLEACPEGGERCAECFRLRLNATARAAKQGGYDMFATTLTVSPHKNAPLINAIGEEAGKKYGVEFLPSDFKKKGGYLHSVKLSGEYDLYRQSFCGCEFAYRGNANDRVRES